MKKLLTLLMLLCVSCMGAWAELGGNLQASTEGVWEHPYFIHNCTLANPLWVRETSGSTGNGAKAGAFAFVKAEGTDNYYIYSIDNQKWLSYEKVNEFANGSDKVILKEEKEHYFKVAYGTCTHQDATTYNQGYTFSPYRTDGAVAGRYLNWYNGAGDYTGTKTMGLYSNGFSDAGSVWVLVEPPFTGVNSLQDLSSANWYYVKLKNKYVKYNASASNLQANYDTADGANEAKFVFVGNYKDGYKIYNLAADAAKVLGAANKNTNTAVTMGATGNAHTFKIELYRQKSSGNDYYWQLRESSTTNAFLNWQNSGNHQIIYWADNVGKGDAANQFVFEKVEGAQYHYVGYEYKIGDEQIESESHFVANNAEYPALKSYAFYQYDTPTGNVTASSSNVFSLNWNGPFEEGRYYRLGVRLDTSGALTRYVKFNSSNNQAGCASGNTAIENETLWKFERVSGSADLFRIYNKAAGKYLSTASNSASVCTADASAANTSYRIYEYTNSTYHKGDNKDFGFVMPDGTDNVLGDHKSSNLGYWNGGTTNYANKMANEGSAFRVVEVPTVDDIQALIDGTLEKQGKVGYPNDMSAINQYATNGVTDDNFAEAYNNCNTVRSSTDIKLPEAGHVYSIMAYFKDNQNSGRYVTNASGTTISAPTDLATSGTAYWFYTGGKFQNSANAANYIAGAESTNMSVNTSGTAFTMVKGLEFGTICIKGGQSHHAINTDGTFGRFTGEDKRQNSGTGYTTDFMFVEAPNTSFVETSVGENPVYYTIKNKNQSRNKFVTASNYGTANMLTQETTASAASYWYFEDASSDIQVNRFNYQPVYLRNAKLGGYITTDKNVNASETITKDADHKEVFYLRLWDNSTNTNGYVVISRTAAKTTGTSDAERNSWSDSKGQGTCIDYWKSQDAGTPFLIERVSTDITSTIATELRDFTVSDDYVGDYCTEDLLNVVPAKATYEADLNAANLNALREAYTQDFYWAATAPARRPISTEKYYVIESAHTGFTTAGTYVLRASSDDTNNKVRWGVYNSSDAKSVWRFDKLVEDAIVNESAGSGWGSVNGTFDIYSLYNVGRQTEGFIGITTFDNPIEFKNSCTLKDTYRPTDKAHAAAFAVVPVEANSSKFNILCNYYTGENSRDNFTLAVSTNATVSTTSGDVTCRNAWGTTPSNATLSQWRIREVAAPVLEDKTVSISNVKVATFYTGKTLTIPTGVTAKKVVDAQDPQQGDVYHLVYEDLQDEIPAGTAVVLFGEANPYQFPRSLEPHDYIVTSAAGDENNRLIGTLASNVTATGKGQDGTLYALGNKDAGVAFYHFLGETLTAGKAYLDASGIGVSGVRAFAIFDEGTGTVTHIDAITGETIGEGTAFDLAGRRINANVKGISIINGKKVIR